MRTVRIAALNALVALVLISSSGCFLDNLFKETLNTSFQRTVTNITYVAHGGYGPNPALVKMWQRGYGSNTLSEIHDYLDPFGGDDSWTALYYGLNHFYGAPYSATYDLNDDTCNGGSYSCLKVGVGAIWDAIATLGTPVIASMGSLNGSALIYQVNNSRVCNSWGSWDIRCQPSFDAFRMHWPVPGAGQAVFMTVDTFGEVYWDGLAYFVYAPSNLDDELGLFNERRGTYYGDPNPPEVSCPLDGDGMCLEEEPEEDPYIYSLAEGPVQDNRPAWAKVSKVVKPYPQTEQEIRDNFFSGLRRLKLHRVPELAGLTDGRLRPGSIESVAGARGDYFILDFVDSVTGRLTVQATLSAKGLVGSVRLVPADEVSPAIIDRAGAISTLAKNYGLRATLERRRVHGPRMPIGSGPFAPWFKGTTSTGDQVLLNSRGEAFTVSVAPSASSSAMFRSPARVQVKALSRKPQ